MIEQALSAPIFAIENPGGFPGLSTFWDMIVFAFWWELAFIIAAIPILAVAALIGPLVIFALAVSR